MAQLKAKRLMLRGLQAYRNGIQENYNSLQSGFIALARAIEGGQDTSETVSDLLSNIANMREALDELESVLETQPGAVQEPGRA